MKWWHAPTKASLWREIMERQRKRLGESIFYRLKQGGAPPPRVSTLFQSPSAGTQPQARHAPPPSVKIEKRFPIGLDLGQSAVKWVQLGMVAGKVTMLQGGCLPISATGEGDRPTVVDQVLRRAAAEF